MLNDYVRVLTKEIDEYPFSVIGTNHLKIGKTQQGTNVRNIAGGYSLKFHETTEIEMRRVSSVNPTTKSSQLKRVEDGNVVDGIELRICIMKNSAAPHSFVDVEMLWYTDFSEQVEKTVFDDESGEEKTVMIYPQRTFFDWDSASVDIVVSLLKEKTTQSRLLADVLHIEKVDRRYCWSKTLGISEKEKISAREMGALLEQELQKNPSLRDALYPVLGIRRRFMYRPGFDYRALLARIAEASHKSTAGVPDEQ
jgi:RecA/RadA recombinase